MGTYVYALNTATRVISGETVGVAEFRYKAGWNDQECYNKLCKRRVTFFDNNPDAIPLLMVMPVNDKANQLVDGQPVYLCKGSCFDDNGAFTRVGEVKKVGRSWTIVLDPGADKIIQIQKESLEQKKKCA